MTPESSFRSGAEFFIAPTQSNHRRYEALRAYFVEGLTHEQAGRRFGYTRWAMVDLVREYRAGRLAFFAIPRKPGPQRGRAPAKERARDRAIELRLAGLSVQQIAGRLLSEGIPLSRTGVSEVLNEARQAGRLRAPAVTSRLPGTGVVDFAELPVSQETELAGLLVTVPDLVALDVPAIVARAGYPDTRKIPAVSWLLSLLVLKLLGRRGAGFPTDPAPALLAGLTSLPREVALTDYSYWVPPATQRALLAALAVAGAEVGVVRPRQRVLHLDAQPLTHWDQDPEEEPVRARRARKVVTLFAQDGDTGNLVFAAEGAPEPGALLALSDHWRLVTGKDPELLVVGRRAVSRRALRELHERGIAFLAPRAGSASLNAYLRALSADDYRFVRVGQAEIAVHEAPSVPLPGFPGPLRQLGISGDMPVVLLTNDRRRGTAELLERHLRQVADGRRLADFIGTHGTQSLSSTVNLSADIDVVLYVLAQLLFAAVANRIPALSARGPAGLRQHFLGLPGQVTTSDHAITVRLARSAWSPILHKAVLPEQTIVPWWGGRALRFEVG